MPRPAHAIVDSQNDDKAPVYAPNGGRDSAAENHQSSATLHWIHQTDEEAIAMTSETLFTKIISFVFLLMSIFTAIISLTSSETFSINAREWFLLTGIFFTGSMILAKSENGL